MNVIASPLFWQPKQNQTFFSGLIENDGDFSVWNGHRPLTLRPTRLSAMCSPASATRSVDLPDPLHVLVEDAHLAAG